jgi:phenylacetate-CoA ligase
MFNKFLTSLLFQIYNLYCKGELFLIYKQIKDKNESEVSFDIAKLKKYLKYWGIKQEITDLPVINKSDIKRHTSALEPKNVYKLFYTGGSTGEPVKIPHSRKRAIIRTASVLFYNKAGGYHSGDRYLFIRSKPKSKLIQFLRNEILFVPNDLSHNNIERIVKIIVFEKVKVLIGYPSVIYEMAIYLDKNPELLSKHTIKSFISNSEPFDEERRDFIKKVLKCKMFDRYSNEENGVIAQQMEYGGEYIVDRYNLYVEVIDPVTLQPVPEGASGKVVITDICSDLIPMIRYDTGDFAIAAKYKNDQLWSIKQIIGRVVDLFYTTSGKPFSPLMLGPFIRIPLTNLGLQIQFQLLQLSRNSFQLNLKATEIDIPWVNIEEVVIGLQSVLGTDALIKIQFVTDIKALSSGKRPLYRNEMTEHEKMLLINQD